MSAFRRNKKGFTLIEVIVAIAIIAILASIVTVTIMAILRSQEKTSATKALKSTWNNSNKALKQLNTGLSTYRAPSEAFLKIHLGTDKIAVGIKECVSLKNGYFYIQYADNPSSVRNRYTLVCIWYRYEDHYYYTTDGKKVIGPKNVNSNNELL